MLGMKVKTSITLDENLLKELDQVGDDYKNRSHVIEQAIRSFLQNRLHQIREAKDLKIINEKAKALNEEVEDVLSYQVDL